MSSAQLELQTLRTRVHNLEKMYETQVAANKKLKEENKRLKEENEKLRMENKELRAKIEKLELIVEELRNMIFKKVKKEKQPKDNEAKAKVPKKKRDKLSYRRIKPDESEVTDTKLYSVSNCNTCGGVFASREEVLRYIEDMILPSDGKYPSKVVHKECIEKGYCAKCDKRTRAKDITSQECTLGDRVRAFVVYGVTVLNFSYEQLKNYMITMVNIYISDGEITKILKHESNKIFGECEAMKKRIRKKGVNHFDETGWNVQSGKEKRYARIMIGKDGIERVYSMGCSRGGGNLEALKGKSKAIGVTDDYGAYKNAFDKHQLCRAHPIRKMRDLVESGKLNKLQIEICRIAYDALRQLHKEILESIKRKKKIDQSTKDLWITQFDELTKNVDGEPEKLLKIKQSLQKNKDKYFTCVNNPGVPTTNNVAERGLRPLVIKRKLSFGSKTQDGAQMMERLYSVAFSITAKHKHNFFDHYFAVRK